jgi:hypothetical protein
VRPSEAGPGRPPSAQPELDVLEAPLVPTAWGLVPVVPPPPWVPPVPVEVLVLSPVLVTSPGDKYPPPGGVQTIIVAGGVVLVGAGSPGAIALEALAAPPSSTVAGPEVAMPVSIASGAHVQAAGHSEADAHGLTFAWQ